MPQEYTTLYPGVPSRPLFGGHRSAAHRADAEKSGSSRAASPMLISSTAHAEPAKPPPRAFSPAPSTVKTRRTASLAGSAPPARRWQAKTIWIFSKSMPRPTAASIRCAIFARRSPIRRKAAATRSSSSTRYTRFPPPPPPSMRCSRRWRSRRARGIHPRHHRPRKAAAHHSPRCQLLTLSASAPRTLPIT